MRIRFPFLANVFAIKLRSGGHDKVLTLVMYSGPINDLAIFFPLKLYVS